MTAASRSLATAPWGALRERLALCYTTRWDTTDTNGGNRVGSTAIVAAVFRLSRLFCS